MPTRPTRSTTTSTSTGTRATSTRSARRANPTTTRSSSGSRSTRSLPPPSSTACRSTPRRRRWPAMPGRRRSRPTRRSWCGSAPSPPPNNAGTAASPNAEVVAYDKTTAKFYVQNTNEGHIEIVSLSASGALTKTGDIDLTALPSYGGSTRSRCTTASLRSLMPMRRVTSPAASCCSTRTARSSRASTVGIAPDQVVFTADGTKLLVANEAEMAGSAANPIQTAGGISIIDLSGGAASATRAQHHRLRRAERRGSAAARQRAGDHAGQQRAATTSSRNTSRSRPTAPRPMSRCRR